MTLCKQIDNSMTDANDSMQAAFDRQFHKDIGRYLVAVKGYRPSHPLPRDDYDVDDDEDEQKAVQSMVQQHQLCSVIVLALSDIYRISP